MNILKPVLIALLILTTKLGLGCNGSSITLNNQTLNPDGSITYNLDLAVELGSLDVTFYGFTISFLSSSNTPQVIIGGTYNTTSSISNSNLNSGFLSGSLQGLTGSNINSVVNDSDWAVYQNSNNVISYESSELFGAASNDISTTIDVTVTGCVEQIIFDASVNSGSSLCEYTINLNNAPYIEVSEDQTICDGDSTTLTIDTAYGGLLTEEFDMTFNSAYSYSTTTTTLPGTYYVIVSGTYYGSANETRDACFGNGWYNGYIWTPGIVWKWNSVNPTNYAQIPSALNTSNHTYQLIFTGGSSYTFSFTDSNYGDNGGSLNFKVYYLGNISWNNGVTTYHNTVNPTSNSTYTATCDNGGCTSSDNVNVTVSNSSTFTDVQSNCNSYTWIDGITYTSNNNTAFITYPSSSGCDSIVYLNLTIHNNTYATDVQSSCSSYTWLDGNTYSSSNNSAIFTTSNAAGCDSIITLDLTILSSSSSNDSVSACDSLAWIDGITYFSSNNSSTFTLSNNQGCDSLISLNLTVNPSYSIQLYDTICSSDLPYNWNSLVFNNSGDQTHFLTSQSNCDSVITYYLAVNDTPNVSINIGDTTICQDSILLLYGIGAENYTWNNNVDDSVYFTPTINGQYIVYGEDTNNCTGSSSINISIDTCYIEPFTINIPNIFTPNNDGENDGFYISGTSFEFEDITILNRWGEVLYQTNGNIPWDGRLNSGTEAPDGNYYYILNILSFDNNISQSKNYKGNFTLLR
jgi:gliding motility-associated-like protein